MNTPKIKSPCHEDWNKMLPEAKGKFCEKCSTIVRDFRHSTSEEIAHHFTTKTGPSCGRFYKYQLVDQKPERHWRFFKRFAFAIFIAFGSTLFTVNSALAQEKITAWKKAFQIEKNGVKKQCDYIIKGKVFDSYSKEPIGFAKITYIKKDNKTVEVIANDKGKFELELDEKDIVDLKKIMLTASTDNTSWYFGHSKEIDLTQPFPEEVEIPMYYEEIMGIEVDPDWDAPVNNY